MKPTTKTLRAMLATTGLTAVMVACGEKPSFVDQPSTLSRRSADAASAPASADAQRAHGGTDDSGVRGSQSGVDASSASTNTANANPHDDTKGDQGPASEGGTDSGNNNNENAGENSDTSQRDQDQGTDGGTSNGSGSEGGVIVPTRKLMAREMSFPADTSATAEVNKALDEAYLTQALTLKRNYYDHSKTVRQIVRPTATDTLVQGTAGDTVSETFDQVAGRLLDILVVVDSSGSMVEEQANLATKLAPLLSAVKDADWQIGLVTTDPDSPSDNCLDGLIKKTDADPAQKFANLVSGFGTGGSPVERPFLTAVRSLKGTCLSQPWIRKDSNVAVLIVSDEDNCSAGSAPSGNGASQNNCGNKAYAKPDYLVNYLASIRAVGSTARVHGIVWHPSMSLAQCRTGYNQAVFTAQAIEATKGAWGSICDNDYTATLNKVSKNILVTLNSKFTLQQEPDLNSLHVYVSGIEVTSGFTVNGRLLEFAQAPAEGAKITVRYHHGSTPLFKSMPLRFAPLADSVSVRVNGQLAPASDYVVTINGNNAAIDFYAYPADKATVTVSYTRNIALSRQFSVGEALIADSLRVRVNGAEVTQATVNAATGMIILPEAPAEGAVIELAYVAVGEPVMSYPLVVDGVAPAFLSVTDAATSGSVGYTYKNGTLVLDPAEFVEGRKIILKYDNPARQRFSLSLPTEPLRGSVVAYAGQKTCTAPAVMVSGTTVSVDGCGFADEVTSVSLRYSFITARLQTFTFTGDKLPSASDYQQWTILVNDLPAKAFTRTANIVTFDQPLPIGSVVKIQLIQEDK